MIHNFKDIDKFEDAKELIKHNILDNFDVKLIEENYGNDIVKKIVYRYLGFFFFCFKVEKPFSFFFLRNNL